MPDLDLTFRIAGLGVRVASAIPACAAAVADLTRLYAAASCAKADLCFDIGGSTGGIVLACNGRKLWKSHAAGEITAAFELHLYREIVAALAPRLLSLHAAAVADRGRVVLFAGPSGSGKSSLCARALLAGCAYLSDEFALVDGRGRIHPFPRPLQWDEATHPALPDERLQQAGFAASAYCFPDANGQSQTSRLWLPPRVRRRPAAIGAVVFPTYTPDLAQPDMRALARDAGLGALAKLLHHELPPADGLARMYRRIPPHTPFFTLRFADVHTAWRRLRTGLT